MKPDDDFAERADAFLSELRRITARHRIAIGGCGCCGSPWLSDLTKAKAKNGKGRYKVERGNLCLEWE